MSAGNDFNCNDCQKMTMQLIVPLLVLASIPAKC
jgi:hypothetical protein